MVTNALIFHSRLFPKAISPPESLGAAHRFSAHIFHRRILTKESFNIKNYSTLW